MSVTVVTPSLPGREWTLYQACQSVWTQTQRPAAHSIWVDHERKGSAYSRNKAASAAVTEWIAPLDDDDELYPIHLEALLAHSADADIVYPYCHVIGRDWSPNREFDADALRQGNYIPITTLIRRDLWEQAGGWRDSSQVAHGWEDWDLWLRALDMGARFKCVPQVTWAYRFGATNKTHVGEREAA